MYKIILNKYIITAKLIFLQQQKHLAVDMFLQNKNPSIQSSPQRSNQIHGNALFQAFSNYLIVYLWQQDDRLNMHGLWK